MSLKLQVSHALLGVAVMLKAVRPPRFRKDRMNSSATSYANSQPLTELSVTMRTKHAKIVSRSSDLLRENMLIIMQVVRSDIASTIARSSATSLRVSFAASAGTLDTWREIVLTVNVGRTGATMALRLAVQRSVEVMPWIVNTK